MNNRQNDTSSKSESAMSAKWELCRMPHKQDIYALKFYSFLL